MSGIPLMCSLMWEDPQWLWTRQFSWQEPHKTGKGRWALRDISSSVSWRRTQCDELPQTLLPGCSCHERQYLGLWGRSCFCHDTLPLQQEEELRHRRRFKVSVCGSVILSWRDPVNSARLLLELSLSKLLGYKIKTKSIAFLCPSDKHVEKELREIVLFKISSTNKTLRNWKPGNKYK